MTIGWIYEVFFGGHTEGRVFEEPKLEQVMCRKERDVGGNDVDLTGSQMSSNILHITYVCVVFLSLLLALFGYSIH